MFNKKLGVYLLGSTLILTTASCSNEKTTYTVLEEESVVEEDLIEVEQEMKLDTIYNFFDESDEEIFYDYVSDAKDFYDENKPSSEEVSGVIDIFKEDLINASSDFLNSVDALKNYVEEKMSNEKIVLENYTYIYPSNNSYYVCKYIDDYVNIDSYTDEDIVDMVNIINSVLFSDFTDEYNSEDKKYIYLSLSNLVNKLSCVILVDNYNCVSENCTNEEYIDYINFVISEKLENFIVLERK